MSTKAAYFDVNTLIVSMYTKVCITKLLQSTNLRYIWQIVHHKIVTRVGPQQHWVRVYVNIYQIPHSIQWLLETSCTYSTPWLITLDSSVAQLQRDSCEAAAALLMETDSTKSAHLRSFLMQSRQQSAKMSTTIVFVTISAVGGTLWRPRLTEDVFSAKS